MKFQYETAILKEIVNNPYEGGKKYNFFPLFGHFSLKNRNLGVIFIHTLPYNLIYYYVLSLCQKNTRKIGFEDGDWKTYLYYLINYTKIGSKPLDLALVGVKEKCNPPIVYTLNQEVNNG
ncbi:MAG: hypothetical protein EHM25_06845 [Nitrosopumilales archaeon]|nr:MAG: hypothetical protein EHM25_06845 [Nitrosopumilales archaeon]